jgi:2,4-diketo-3-deoxy-L-fuconate hydrolase
LVRLANLDGRATLALSDGVGVDIATASEASLPADPMAYSDVSLHPSLRELAASAATARWGEPFEPSRLGPPVPRPSKIVAVGLNYQEHANETPFAAAEEPAIFAKFPSSLCGPFDDIVLPAGRSTIDYEMELVAVIGRRVKNVAEADAWGCLAGLTGGQDISDRAEQLRPPIKQFSLAKSYDTFSPTGPYLVTLDELDDPQRIELSCTIDSEQVQHAWTDEMIYSIPYVVAWTSRYVTLEPGDLLFTGTPSGIGAARRPRLFLRDRMVVTSSFAGIGTMQNMAVVASAVTDTGDHDTRPSSTTQTTRVGS